MKGGEKMNKFYSTNNEEQETIINIEYGAKKVNFYTSRYSAYNRLYKNQENQHKHIMWIKK